VTIGLELACRCQTAKDLTYVPPPLIDPYEQERHEEEKDASNEQLVKFIESLVSKLKGSDQPPQINCVPISNPLNVTVLSNSPRNSTNRSKKTRITNSSVNCNTFHTISHPIKK